MILADGVEEVEAVAPVDLLRRAGVEVTLAAAQDDWAIAGRNGMELRAEKPLAACSGDGYDAIVIPGGPGHKALRANARVVNLVRDQVGAGKLVGAICAGPLVLLDAGVLAGRRYTAHPSTRAELPEAETDSPVVRDGLVITSQGAGTAVAFGLALVEAICGEEASASVRKAICG